MKEICTKCGKEIDPNEARSYDEDDNRECLDCHFDYMNNPDVTIIAMVEK